ncbi:endonuclease/exonuclease/phosphatase family protein [Pelomyxa schiedti]|nr:endonuclease/exonuclease/phosphatase family protein [Pelomyxa schiedti]
MDPSALQAALASRKTLAHVDVKEPTLADVIRAKEGAEFAVPWWFDPSVSGWVQSQDPPPAASSSSSSSSASSSPSPSPSGRRTISVVTYNVWFEDYFRGLRTQRLLDLVAERDPDVVVLEEMTKESLAVLRSHKWFQAGGYWLSDAVGDTWGGRGTYGVVVASRLPIDTLSIRKVPTVMGRKLVVASVRLPHSEGSELMCIVGCHLESTSECGETRTAQLRAAISHSKNFPHTIILGDTNINNEEEASVLFRTPSTPTPTSTSATSASTTPASTPSQAENSSTFVDVWKAFAQATGSSDPGLTRFPVLSPPFEPREPRRLDRVFARNLRIVHAEVFGKEPIPMELTPGAEKPVLPSDHYGFHCTLSF